MTSRLVPVMPFHHHLEDEKGHLVAIKDVCPVAESLAVNQGERGCGLQLIFESPIKEN